MLVQSYFNTHLNIQGQGQSLIYLFLRVRPEHKQNLTLMSFVSIVVQVLSVR